MKKAIYILIGMFIMTGFVSCSDEFLEPELQQTKRYEEGLQETEDLHNLIIPFHFLSYSNDSSMKFNFKIIIKNHRLK